MKRLTYPLTLLIFLVVPSLYAQEATAPWPPDPSEIFAEGVEVVSVESEAGVDQNFRPQADNLARELRIWMSSEQEWEHVPYPETVEQVSSIIEDDQQFILTVVEQGSTAEDMPLNTLWLLDLETFALSRFESPCLDWENDRGAGMVNSGLYTEIVHGDWIFYTDDRISRTTLCHTTTGEMVSLLPNDIAYWWSTLESPDGAWVIVFGGDTEYLHNYVTMQVYAVETTSGRINHLGEMWFLEVFYFERWISNTQGFLYSGLMPESGTKIYASFDVTRPNSLQLITGWSEYREAVRRFDYLQTYYEVTHRADPLDYPTCAIFWYSVENREGGSYDLGHDCFGTVQWHERVDHYYYLTYARDGSERLALTRLNMSTGEQTEVVLSEEFMALDSVSPDGRYAIVSLNEEHYPLFQSQEGKHYPTVMELDPFYYHGGLSTQYVVVDTLSGEILSDGTNLRGRIHWVDDTQFAMVSDRTEESISVIHIADGEISESQINIEGYLTIRPDYGNRGFLQSEEGLMLIDLVDASINNLVHREAQDLYSIATSINENDEIEVRVTPKNGFSLSPSVTYIIRLP